MPTLYFTGDQVAVFDSLDENDGEVTFGGITNPFQPGDLIEVGLRDRDVRGNGEFKKQDIEIQSLTVIRDGERYEVGLDEANIKGPGGKEQGDTYFTTNEEVLIDEAPFGPLEGKLVFSSTDTFQTGQTTTTASRRDNDFNDDGDSRGNQEAGNGTFNAQTAESPPCFAPGTRIATPEGLRAVERLVPGDRVQLAGGGTARIVLTHVHHVAFAAPSDPARPIRIEGGALHPGTPMRPLVLSPQHCVLAGPGGWLAGGVGRPALVRAKALTGLPGIRAMRGLRRIAYHALLLNRHGILLAEGAAVESLWPGGQALRALGPAGRAALERRFPGIIADPATAYGPMAAPCLTVQQARALAARHRTRRARPQRGAGSVPSL